MIYLLTILYQEVIRYQRHSNFKQILLEFLIRVVLNYASGQATVPNCSFHLPASSLQLQPLGLDLEPDSVIKILGLQWNPVSDSFSYEIKPLNEPCTKRSILSELARIYDPLGFLSPVVLFIKNLLQILWTIGIDWDSAPPEGIVKLWSQLKSEFGVLSSIQVPRLIISYCFSSCQLHGFADASQKGYAAVIYIRIVHSDHHITTHLICAKSRVPPTKRISIPRLELCGALLLSDLICNAQRLSKKNSNFLKFLPIPILPQL
ncbi:hypothetical protein JTB14_023189 [Gonioctena quinquepunctata]|nr:hypothetical protein JTB14_023189 [Gonioctena quinquepunctata]